MSWQNDGDWPSRQEQEDNAQRKQEILWEVERLADTDDFREASARIKELHQQWKGIGFAGKGEHQRLGDAYYAARNRFYERQNQYWQNWNYEADQNRDYARRLINHMTGYANDSNPAGWTNQVRALIQEFRNLKGPMRKDARARLNQEFWSEKDRFYARVDLQKARPKEFQRGDYWRTETQRSFGGAPDTYEQAKRQLDEAIRDAEARVRDADAYYEEVRARDPKVRFNFLPRKQHVDEGKARERQRIARDKLENLRRRRDRMR